MPDRPMRWKLLIAASLLAAVAGAGACLLAARLLFGPAAAGVGTPGWAAFVLVLPLAAIVAASVFVYRHTARRRSLQAMATALLASLLTLTALVTAAFYFNRPLPHLPPPEASAPVD